MGHSIPPMTLIKGTARAIYVILPCELWLGQCQCHCPVVQLSLVPSLPDLFNAREKRGGAWYLKSRDKR